jgi:predicted dehydrogenase
VSAQPPSTTATARATLRAGIIGLGVGQRHVDAYRRHPACEVAVLCDVAGDRLRAAAARHPDLDVVADPGAVLADPRINLVSIASWDDAHAGQVLEALDQGKHVFVEKPLCRTADEARRIRTALRARPDLRLSSNLVLRASPRFRLVRGMIAGGEFGDLFHLEGEYNYGRLHKLTHGWRGSQQDYSVVLGGAVHLVDLLLWLTGRRVTEVAAFGNGIASGSRFAGDDMVAALLRFEDGVTATLTANFGCVRPHGHGLVVCGTTATFVNDHPHGRLYASRDADVAPQPVTAPHPGAGKGDLIGSFVDHVLGTGPPAVTADDVFAAMAVCLAIDEARRCGAVVPVEAL